jgi:hypothetical protein
MNTHAASVFAEVSASEFPKEQADSEMVSRNAGIAKTDLFVDIHPPIKVIPNAAYSDDFLDARFGV